MQLVRKRNQSRVKPGSRCEGEMLIQERIFVACMRGWSTQAGVQQGIESFWSLLEYCNWQHFSRITKDTIAVATVSY